MTRRSWWSLAALLLAAVQLPVLIRTGADPSQSDFANYFTPANVLVHGGDVGALYDADEFGKAMGRAGLEGLGSFIPHPPANALWLAPLALLPPAQAKGLWTLVLVAGLALTILALSRLPAGLSPGMAAVIVLAPMLSVRNALAFGQPYPLLAALLAGGALALERGRGFTAGLLLGLGVSFKPYALCAGFLFLSRERRRSLAGFLCGAIAPSLLLWALAGIGPFVGFTTRVLPWMLRGEIQDPFSPVWGSVSALCNRLLRFEPDLNPHPWIAAPLLARFSGAAISASLLALGVLSGRRAMNAGRTLDAIAITVAFALAASPFAASYHLVLFAVPVAAIVARRSEGAGLMVVAFWSLLGSSAVNLCRDCTGPLIPLAYARLFGILVLALAVSWPLIDRRVVGLSMAAGALIGSVALRFEGRDETWPRIESARGYSMAKPYFCGPNLRWLSPSADGHRWESRGPGEDCERPDPGPTPGGRGVRVVSRFSEGSFNLYLQASAGASETPLTRSPANEIEPVATPDGCAVVFASDQGRGLGSTALYRLDLAPLIDGCAGSGRVSDPR